VAKRHLAERGVPVRLVDKAAASPEILNN